MRYSFSLSRVTHKFHGGTTFLRCYHSFIPLEFTPLAPLGQRVDRNRRYYQSAPRTVRCRAGRAGPMPAEGEPASREQHRLRPAGG